MSGVDQRISPEEIRRVDARWKSDVDLKLDRLVAFANAYEPFLIEATKALRDRAALRQAVIEKTLAGLIWAGIVFLGVAVWNYVRNHLR